MAMANGGVKAVSKYWQSSQQEEPELPAGEHADRRLTMPPLNAFDNSIKDPDIDGQLAAGVVKLSGRSGSRGSTSGQACLEKLSDIGFSCANAIYEYPIPTAYVRFHEGVGQSSRIVTSKEIFHILKDCGSTV